MFGVATGGRPVELYTLTNPSGIEADIMTYGAALHQLRGPDGTNIVLGFPTLDGYVANDRHYFGATVGRCANRIAGAAFTLDGVLYELPANDGPNCLHGGPRGFDKQVWEAELLPRDSTGVSLALRYTSPDGEMGFPGAVSVEVTYTLSDNDALRIEYTATTDAPTIVNLTNHTSWNLAGEGAGTILDHVLEVDAQAYTPIDTNHVPTGEIAPVAGTPLDFTAPTPIRARIADGSPQIGIAGGYDHNFVLDPNGSGELARAAKLLEPASGRTLEVLTTEPGIQVYSGNFLDERLVGPSGRPYGRFTGLALETQHFPDSPNQPAFPSAVLRPGETFRSTTIFRLGFG